MPYFILVYIFVSVMAGMLGAILYYFFKEYGVIHRFEKVFLRGRLFQELGESLRTLLANLSIIQNSNSFYRNLQLDKWQKILKVKKIGFLEDVKDILENLVTYADLLKGLDPQDIKSFIDVGTDGGTTVICMLGLDWYGFNSAKGYNKTILKQIKLLESLQGYLPCAKLGRFINIGTNYPQGDQKFYDVSFMDKTIHHLSEDLEVRLDGINRVLNTLWEHTKKRLILQEFIIKKNHADPFTFLDEDGGQYFTSSDLMRTHVITSNLNEVKLFSQNGEDGWYSLLNSEQSDLSITYGDFYRFYLDKK